MQFKRPKNDSKYSWTNHVVGKMLYYKISEGLVRRVITSPHRAEEGVAPNTIAVMQKTGTAKNPKEIWVMYVKDGSKKRIITAWRYPGISAFSLMQFRSFLAKRKALFSARPAVRNTNPGIFNLSP